LVTLNLIIFSIELLIIFIVFLPHKFNIFWIKIQLQILLTNKLNVLTFKHTDLMYKLLVTMADIDEQQIFALIEFGFA